MDYAVKENDIGEARALKKARDALTNDPFFKDKRHKELRGILEWLVKNKRRCEQHAADGNDGQHLRPYHVQSGSAIENRLRG